MDRVASQATQHIITKIIFNGKESYQLFLTYFGKLEKISNHVVTSRLLNRMKFDDKLAFWRKALI
jgi:hypothetical protein